MARVRGLGCYLPERVVKNAELGPMVGADPQWIRQATGIEQRRFAEPSQSVAELGILAARDCLDSTHLDAGEIGLLICASGSGECRFPGPASSIGAALGMGGVPAIDLPMASAGSLFGIALAAKMAESYGNVLVIGAEIMSRTVRLDPTGRDTAILFGDGAGACVVSRDHGFARIIDVQLASDGAFAESLQLHFDAPLYMEGRTIILHAARKIPRVIQELLERNSCAAAQVGTYLLHQANLNLITRVAQALSVPEQRFFSNLDRFGNTSSASLLIAATEWWRGVGRMKAPVVMAAFGAGFHWGAILLGP